MKSGWNIIRAIIWQDLALAVASGWGGIVSVLFFLSCAMLAPFALGPNPEILGRIAGGLAWMSALLAMLLSLDRLFQPDLEDGSIDQWVSQGQPLGLIGFAKIIAHWLTTALPLILAAPIVAVMLGLPGDQLGRLMLSLVLGTPALSALGAACAALALPVKRAAMLISLLVLPLAVPVLIFGVAAFDVARAAAGLKLLGSASLLGLALAPLAISVALKESVS